MGTTLRDHALDWFDEQSVDEIWAAIEPMNTASEALHRGAGFVPVPVHGQLARWGWHLPEILARTHVLIGTNLRVWLRRAKPDPTWWRPQTWWTVTLPITIMLIALASLRSPRELTFDARAVIWLVAIPLLLVGSREGLVRLVARTLGQSPLRHVPWSHGVPLAVVLAAAFGTWLPLTGSSTPAPGGRWRVDEELRWMLPAHLVGALPVAALAWVLVLTAPEAGAIPWSDLTRAAMLLAFFDLVFPIDHFVGTTARLARTQEPAPYSGAATSTTSTSTGTSPDGTMSCHTPPATTGTMSCYDQTWTASGTMSCYSPGSPRIGSRLLVDPGAEADVTGSSSSP